MNYDFYKEKQKEEHTHNTKQEKSQDTRQNK